MKTFRIYVTQDDIDKGDPCCGSKCAIARAMNKMFDGLEILVSSVGIFFRKDLDIPKNAVEIILPTPIEAVEFIELYDTKYVGKQFTEPFNFELTMSDEAYEKLVGKVCAELEESGMSGPHLFSTPNPTVAAAVTQPQN